MNKVIQKSDLECPDVELDCVLKKLFEKYSSSIVETPIQVVLGTGVNAGTVTITNEDGTAVTFKIGIPFTSTPQSSDGLTLNFNIPHTLGTIPTGFPTIAASTDAQDIAYVTATTTNIVVHYNVAPPVGTNNLIFTGVVFK